MQSLPNQEPNTYWKNGFVNITGDRRLPGLLWRRFPQGFLQDSHVVDYPRLRQPAGIKRVSDLVR
jgi:hypothetical protein